jgi:hypothetical protein
VRACHGARWKQRRHVCRENVLWAGKRSVGGAPNHTKPQHPATAVPSEQTNGWSVQTVVVD